MRASTGRLVSLPKRPSILTAKCLVEVEFNEKKKDWLPSGADGEFIQSLMVPCYEAGKYAGWISPPKVGIDNKPGDFEYVKLHMA